MNRTAVIASWSGGKDSCLACYRAMRQGHKIERLLNFISKEYRRCCFHGVEADILKLQSALIGIPLVQEEVTSDMAAYEKEFKAAVASMNDVGGMVFGDIYLDEHKDWVERVCRDIGVRAIEPLWQDPPLDLVREFIDSGFKAVVVSCQADKFGKDFVGRYIDHGLIDELVSKGICPCGENGEFHTLVVDGPIFKRAIKILKSEPVLKEGFWKYWFLDIKKYA